ncbi:MAG: sulfotransferase family protein [Oligoflexia bacterium]|nr:sulfotransferase family protein [Oligoflexia bacterium]
MTLQVIGSGLGRTGTRSMKDALEVLGFGPTFHMTELYQHPELLPVWDTQLPDWSRALTGFHSTLDYPAALYWRALHHAFPQARVLHTTRDPDQWYDSVLATIYPASHRWSTPQERALADFIERVVWQGQFHGRFEDRSHAIEVFLAHERAVVSAVPASRLLIYRVGSGWGPLCTFLEVEPPCQPYPRLNSRDAFRARTST